VNVLHSVVNLHQLRSRFTCLVVGGACAVVNPGSADVAPDRFLASFDTLTGSAPHFVVEIDAAPSDGLAILVELDPRDVKRHQLRRSFTKSWGRFTRKWRSSAAARSPLLRA
jgi:hypothetical protein